MGVKGGVFHSFVRSCNCFILLRVTSNPESIPETLGIAWEYTLDGMPDNQKKAACTYSHIQSHLGEISSHQSPIVGYFPLVLYKQPDVLQQALPCC